MNDLSESSNILGMGELLLDSSQSVDIDIDKLEKSIVQGYESQPHQSSKVDFSAEYNRELEQIMKEFRVDDDMGGGSGNVNMSAKTPKLSDLSLQLMENNDGFNNMRPDSSRNRAKTPMSRPRTPAAADFSYGPRQSSTPIGAQLSSGRSQGGFNGGLSTIKEESGDGMVHSSWMDQSQDAYMTRLTNEERKRTHISNVLSNIHNEDKDEMDLLQQEEEEDEMAKILEQIDMLRSNLEDAGVDVSKVPQVSTNTPKKDAKKIMKILRIKNDRLSYRDMFEESILAAAYGLEQAFDGKREWFGYKPDLTGWPDTVQTKLKRLRVDTSTLVSDIMRGHNIGSGWRIVLDLLPSMIFYSRQRRVNNSDNLISDDRYKEAMRNLNN
jgi:hypothetical protein